MILNYLVEWRSGIHRRHSWMTGRSPEDAIERVKRGLRDPQAREFRVVTSKEVA